MILRRDVAEGVAAGHVSLAFRRWSRPRVRSGDTFMSVAGLIVVGEVTIVDPRSITLADAKAAGYQDVRAVLDALRGSGSSPVRRIVLSWGGPDPRSALALKSDLSNEDVATITRSLDRMDQQSRRGPWTQTVLALIGERPGVRSAELAAELGRDRDALKRDVRRLKGLGLTISLGTGYELSPRGAALPPDV